MSKITKLSNLFCDELSKIPGVTVYRPEEEAKRNSIVSFSIDGFEPQTVIEKLEKQKIVLAVREIFDQKIIRAAPHFFNTESEMQKVAEAIKAL